MNESNPTDYPVETAAPDYKDRSTGLVVFGIFTLLLGGLCGLFSLLMLFGKLMAPQTTQTPTSSLLPILIVYGVLAVSLIWVGIGSIRARRWARALLLIFSWSWLMVGIMALVGMACFVPKVLGNLPSTTTPNQPAMPPAAMVGVMVFMFLFFGVFFALLPALWIFFYSSRHVKATCEARDPVTRWTDACPLPVLGLCLCVMFGVPMMILMPLSGHFVMPFFGIFLTGIPCALICLAMAALWSYAAWLMYHLKPQGWWIILIAMVIYTVSGLITFGHHDMLEMYQLMGYPQAQIDQIQKMGLLTGNNMMWFTALYMALFLGYLLFIKKYFRAKT